MSFNPSVEGQLLQLIVYRIKIINVVDQFQSLCRGTAIATSMPLYWDEEFSMFQSLCRGTAIATKVASVSYYKETRFQSLCRGTAIATELC